MRSCLTALALLWLPYAALAECNGGTLISRDTGNGRQLEVCIEPTGSRGDGAFTYAFGPKGQPKLTLREGFAAGTATPWSGVGRAIRESVGFRNGDHVYEAWHSLDRLTEDPLPQAGVNILHGEELLASLTCESGPGTVVAPLFTIYDAMTAAGVCHDPSRQEWRQGGCG